MNIESFGLRLKSQCADWSNPIRLKELFITIFKNILIDQLDAAKWTVSDKDAVEMLNKEFKQIEINEQSNFEDCLGSVENIAFRLSSVIKPQLGNIKNRGAVFKAAENLDNFYIELYSRRLLKGAVPKAVEALAKVSYDGAFTLSKFFFNPLINFCNGLIQENKIQEVSLIYERTLTEVNGALIIKRFNEMLIGLDQNHRDKIKVIIASLRKATIEKMQGWFLECMRNDQMISATACLEVMLLCEEHAAWCSDQIIKKYIEKGHTDEAKQLIDKYLWNNPKTSALALGCIKELIHRYMKQSSYPKVMELIDKYQLMDKPETQAQGIEIVEDAIKRNITQVGIEDGDKDCIDHAMLLIEKYLWWTTPEHRIKAQGYIEELIDKSLEKEDEESAVKIINKFIIFTEPRNQGRVYINKLISEQLDKNRLAAYRLYDNYMTCTSLFTEIEFDNCIRYIELQNRSGVSGSNQVRQLEESIRILVVKSDLTEEQKRILRNFVAKMTSSKKDKIVTLLCIAKTHIKDQPFVKELASIFIKQIENDNDPALTKSIQHLF